MLLVFVSALLNTPIMSVPRVVIHLPDSVVQWSKVLCMQHGDCRQPLALLKVDNWNTLNACKPSIGLDEASAQLGYVSGALASRNYICNQWSMFCRA